MLGATDGSTEAGEERLPLAQEGDNFTGGLSLCHFILPASSSSWEAIGLSGEIS